MTDYRIVPATADDLPAIERLAHRIWPDTFGDILSPEQIDYMLARMYKPTVLGAQLEQGHVFLLLLAPTPVRSNGSAPPTYAERSRRYAPVGYIGYEKDYLPGTTKIHKIYLLPEMQGRGLGRVLLRTVERKAVRAGQRRLRLDVNYQNKALGFYEHYGFRKLDRFDTDIGNGFLMEDWRMEKSIGEEGED